MLRNADSIIRILKEAGVRRLFGMIGGGSNADLVEAADRAGLPFSLSQTEAGSAFMACAQAEVTGSPGACIATLGPGAASLMNGVAAAHLERVPLIVITDCWDETTVEVMQHQNLQHGKMFSPVTKWTFRARTVNTSEILRRAVKIASESPPGPVHIDVSNQVTAAAASADGSDDQPLSLSQPPTQDFEITGPVQEVIRKARRPVFLVGLGARTAAISTVLKQMCDRFGIPALVTYKAKGVIPDRFEWFGGVLTNGALELEVLRRSDLLLAIGLDCVELLPKPWRLTQPVIGVTPWTMNQKQIPQFAEFVGDVVSWLGALADHLAETEWHNSELQNLVESQREAMRPKANSGNFQPHRVVELTADVYPDARVTVDAGAHMFSVMSLWPAKEPCSVLISNGLSTMGFALPSAIGAALLDISSPVVCFTGDGGLLMCLGELRTAAREGLLLRVIVFDDAALSLIKIKQIQRGYATIGVDMGITDWRSVASGLGFLAREACSEEAMRACLLETANHPGPVLIAAKVDPQVYQATIRALRG